MNNNQKYDQAFIDAFSITKDKLNNNLIYESISEWDSVGHMSMIAALEESFNISMEMDDIVDFSSYNVGKALLKKYKIKLK
ncbi:MAG: acyl carrier protein [SAR202 cluster bacterium]|nr:acyl carrier protein [SAR202 cluster bacterium]